MTGANQAGPAAAGPGGPSSLRQLWRYLVRHWRGELSLRHAVWQSGFLAYVLLLSPCLTVLIFGANLVPLPLGLFAEPLLWFAVVLAAGWHLVGIWRSAGRAAGADGRPASALPARAAVLLALVIVADLAWVRAVPRALDAFDMVFRDDPEIGPHNIRLLSRNTEIEISGGLTIGVADELEAMLARYPETTVIHLNSPGGRMSEGFALQAVIRRHGLITYTGVECDSACTLAFLGGRERWIGPTASLGFHHASAYPGETRREREAEESDLVRGMQGVGVSPAFARRVLDTPFDGLWRPTVQELLDNHVVTGVSDGTQFAIGGIEAGTPPERVEEALLAAPWLAAFRKLEPAVFSRLRDTVAEIVARGGTEHELAEAEKAAVMPYALQYLPLASDLAVARMAQSWVEMIDAVRTSPSGDCLAFIQGRLDPAVVRRAIPADLLSRYWEAVAEVFGSAASARRPEPLAADDAKRGRAALRAILEPRYGDAVSLLEGNDPPPDQGDLFCQMKADLYRTALALPAERRGPALRALVSRRPVSN
ncbi:MAG: hypothetical protein U1E53_26010 [Dongiaceae bacterium]